MDYNIFGIWKLVKHEGNKIALSKFTGIHSAALDVILKNDAGKSQIRYVFKKQWDSIESSLVIGQESYCEETLEVDKEFVLTDGSGEKLWKVRFTVDSEKGLYNEVRECEATGEKVSRAFEVQDDIMVLKIRNSGETYMYKETYERCPSEDV